MLNFVGEMSGNKLEGAEHLQTNRHALYLRSSCLDGYHTRMRFVRLHSD